ncbi:hypothetical protein PAMP_012782 [Pampus punctatissimus]
MAGQQSLLPSYYQSYWEKSTLTAPWMWTGPIGPQRQLETGCREHQHPSAPLPGEGAGVEAREGESSTDGRPVCIFPDLTSAIIKKRKAFQHIKKKCKARKICCGFRHPARFVVTVDDNTGTLRSPAKAEKFLSREAQDWDTDI